MATVQLLGLDVLTEQGKETVREIANGYLVKIDRFLATITSLIVHVKMYNRGGTRKEYEIRLRVDSPDGFFESRKTEWNLGKALKHVFDAVLHEIKHKLRI